MRKIMDQSLVNSLKKWVLEGIKITMCIMSIVILLLFFISCATNSLHSPKPNKPGKFSIGAHPGFFLAVADGGIDAGSPILTGTMRFGIFNGGELGLNIGMLGGDLAFKYGFMDYEKPFQLSVIAGTGLYGFELFHFNGGILTGYEISNNINIYGGYRHFFYPAVYTEFDSLGVGIIIVGFEFFPKKVFSPALEIDYNIFMPNSEFSELNEGFSGIYIINTGFNINF